MVWSHFLFHSIAMPCALPFVGSCRIISNTSRRAELNRDPTRKGAQGIQVLQVAQVEEQVDEQDTQVGEQGTQVGGQVAQVEAAKVKPKGTQGEAAADAMCQKHHEDWMKDYFATWEADKLPAALEPFADICEYTREGNQAGMKFSMAKLDKALVSTFS